MVVDTSALIAVLFKETHARWVASKLSEHAGRLKMGTVNLADCIAYALAMTENDAVHTLDRDFTKTNVRCLTPKSPAKT